MTWKCAQLCVVACVAAGVLLQGDVARGQTTFTVTPENQPKESESAATLLLYADLNGRLAAAVEDPDAGCLKTYADYQTCKAGEKPKKCKGTPKCAVTAKLPQMDWAHVVFHFAPGEGIATLVPHPESLAPHPDASASSTKIPKDIKMIHEDSPPPPGMAGMSGGTPGGVMGSSVPGGGAPVVMARPQGFQGPQRISPGVSAGYILKRFQPSYPPIAKVAHLSGTVMLRAIITKEGTINSLQVISASSPLFENSAIDAVRQWQYKPYLLNGEPTEVDTLVTVNFNLNGG